MTVQLQNIPRTLEDLVLQLREDSDIRIELQQIISEARDVSCKYHQVMENEGRAVLRNKSVLVETLNPSEVDVQKLKDSLTLFQSALKQVRDDMLVLQSNVGNGIEKCRRRAREYSDQIKLKQTDIYCLRSQIDLLQCQINECEEIARTQENLARKCEDEASALNLKAVKHCARGAGDSSLLLSAGVAVSLLTGGIAGFAILGTAALGNLGGRLHCAKECHENARVHSQRAFEKNREATRYRISKGTQEKEKYSMETEVKQLQIKNDNINDDMNKLRQIEGQLYTAVSVIDNATLNVQNLDTTLFDAKKHGNPFKIIQNAFVRNPAKFEGKAQEYLNKLKNKWMCVERDLVNVEESRQIRY